MADEQFRTTGLSPSHAFLMMLVNDPPRIGPKLLGDYLNLAPSTATRRVDSLIYKGLLTKSTHGKNTNIYATDNGKDLTAFIDAASKKI